MSSARILVVGSVNVDLVVRVDRLPVPGETVTGGEFERHGGGKSANQAVAAARLGAQVALIAAVGDDDLGAEAMAELEREGVDTTGIARLSGVPTGVALIAVDRAGENQIAVASGANAMLDAAAEPGAGADAASDLAPAGGAPGVTLLGLEVPDAPVLDGARTARAAGGTIVLNPAPARRLPDELLDLGPLLTPNAAEACALTREREPAAAARALARRTGAAVVVTLGGRGALVVEPDRQPEHVPAIEVSAVDTTGAGDAFNGALAAELARGAELGAAARFAVAAAGLSTRARGARGGLPDRDSVLAALAG